jgi:uncharacterized protein
MPSRTLKTQQDCTDFLTGLKLLGTGGGGSPKTGLELLTNGLAEGLNLTWIDAADLAEDVFTCTTYGSGSISAGRPESKEEIEAFGKKKGLEVKFGDRAPEMAVRYLAEYTGVKIGALVAAELGASNTPAPLVTAARMGIALVDGDYSGRAVPEDMQTTSFLKGVKTYPAAITDWWGDVLILKEAVNTTMGERMGKMLAIASHGVVFVASIVLSAKDTRDTVVPGTLTLSLELGRAVRQAREAGKSPTAEAARILDGWELFTGEVTGKESGDKEGVMVGTTHIRGTGAFTGHTLDIWFLNENHVSWLDGKPFVFSPDLIILANPQSGDGYTNTEIKEGDPVTVLGAKVFPAFRSPKALEFFGPRYWGFDFDYVPIEKAVGK